MQPSKSRFEILLNAFRISGKELAELLHIDSSLVSKWKNNKRSMKSNSPHLNSIVQHFIALDSFLVIKRSDRLSATSQTIKPIRRKSFHWP
jgi:transcriptional regulator with XRE-family HTH domain